MVYSALAFITMNQFDTSVWGNFKSYILNTKYDNPTARPVARTSASEWVNAHVIGYSLGHTTVTCNSSEILACKHRWLWCWQHNNPSIMLPMQFIRLCKSMHPWECVLRSDLARTCNVGVLAIICGLIHQSWTSTCVMLKRSLFGGSWLASHACDACWLSPKFSYHLCIHLFI